MINGQLLFPTHILHALNALQHLRCMYILGDCGDSVIFSTCEEIAQEIGAPKDPLWRTMMHLSRAGIVNSKKGGGYHVTAPVLHKIKIIDVLSALGKELPINGTERASDRLHTAISDCLDVSLEEFFKG